jgi:hypothetical protein
MNHRALKRINVVKQGKNMAIRLDDINKGQKTVINYYTSMQIAMTHLEHHHV